MILSDFSQLIIGAAKVHFNNTKTQIDINLLRHICLNTLIQTKQRNMGEYENKIVLCFDSKKYWREEIFQYYKKNRIKLKEKDAFDWKEFAKNLAQIKAEFTENLPYNIIELDGAEADDIIGTLCREFKDEKILIISSDNDFIQLHEYSPTIKQYSPILKKMIDKHNCQYNLFEHVVRGDTGDGIPNIFSDDDTFMVQEKRQKSINQEKLLYWEREYGFNTPEMFCRDIDDLNRFKRNKKLIMLENTPMELQEQIITKFKEPTANKNKVFNYLVKNKLTKILENGVI